MMPRQFGFQRENYLWRDECEINHRQLLRVTFHSGCFREYILFNLQGIAAVRGGQQVFIINIYFVAGLIVLLNARV